MPGNHADWDPCIMKSSSLMHDVKGPLTTAQRIVRNFGRLSGGGDFELKPQGGLSNTARWGFRVSHTGTSLIPAFLRLSTSSSALLPVPFPGRIKGGSSPILQIPWIRGSAEAPPAPYPCPPLDNRNLDIIPLACSSPRFHQLVETPGVGGDTRGSAAASGFK